MRTLLLALILLPIALLGQNPGAAFISGDFSGWNKLEGTKYYGIGLQTLLTPNPSNNAFRFAAQSDTSAYDPNTDSLIKVVPAGFGHSMRLGDFVGGIEAERMTYTWTISEENAILSYKYALVSQEPNHAPQWLPTVGFLVMDQDSAVIECSEQLIIPSYTDLPLETAAGSFPVVKYNKWRTVTIDLSPYVGQTMTFVAANSDCGLGQHFSYVYFAVQCFAKTSVQHYCKKSDEIYLNAPEGFDSYAWNTGDSNRVLYINSPSAGDTFTCQTTTFTCTTDFEIVISESDVTADFDVLFDTNLLAAVFNNGSMASNSSIVNYQWDFGDGATSIIENPTHTYDSFGVFNVTLIVTNDSGCQDSMSRSFVNFPPPYPDFSVSDSCGLEVQFSNLTQPPFIGEITGYRWDFGDGFTSSEVNPRHAYASGGSYKVTLIAEASNIVTDEISKRAVIHPLPKAGFISEPACIGNPTLFEDNSTIVSGIITSWTWNISDSLNLDSQNLNLTFSSPGNIEVVLSVVSDKGCKDSTLQMVEVYPETVYADFGYNPNPIQALETRVVFLDSSENATSWFWSIDSVFISSEKNPEYEFLRDTGRYSVRLEVENRFGCLADTSRVLVVQPIVSLYIPSAYSPDGDGVNDQFIIRGEGIESMLITIRDRWGNEVAQIDRWNVPISIPWIDSENSSVYSYDGTFIDKNEIRHYLNGTITVLK